MEVNPNQLIKFVESDPRFKGEVATYWESMKKLPDFDYSKFYAYYPDYASTIMQGDGIRYLKVISLPDEGIAISLGIVLSNTCDINLENERKFSARMVYAPVMILSAYEQLLKEAQGEDPEVNDEKKFTDEQVDAHIDQIRQQKISQAFYLPAGKYLPEEALIFFDNICSCSNEAVSRDDLSSDRMFSLSAYGWHIFMEKIIHFFTKLSDETVELRFNPLKQ